MSVGDASTRGELMMSPSSTLRTLSPVLLVPLLHSTRSLPVMPVGRLWLREVCCAGEKLAYAKVTAALVRVFQDW